MNTGLVRGRFCWQPTVYCSFQYVAWKVVTWDNPTVAAVGQLRNITNVISRWWISRPVEEDHYCPVLICQLNYLSCVHQLFITQDPLLEPWPRQSLDWSSLWKIARLFGQVRNGCECGIFFIHSCNSIQIISHLRARVGGNSERQLWRFEVYTSQICQSNVLESTTAFLTNRWACSWRWSYTIVAQEFPRS